MKKSTIVQLSLVLLMLACSSDGRAQWRPEKPVAKGVTPAQAAYWDNALAKMAASEEWKKEIDGTNMQPRTLRAAAFTKFLDAEYAATRAVMTDLGLTK